MKLLTCAHANAFNEEMHTIIPKPDDSSPYQNKNFLDQINHN